VIESGWTRVRLIANQPVVAWPPPAGASMARTGRTSTGIWSWFGGWVWFVQHYQHL